MSQFEDSQVGGILLLGGQSDFLFCSGLQLIFPGPPTLRRIAVLPSLLIQMFISSKNILLEMPRIMFDQTAGYPAALLR